MFKVDDEVLIRKDLKEILKDREKAHKLDLVDSMALYSGMKTKIYKTVVREWDGRLINFYYLDIDEGCHRWCENLLTSIYGNYKYLKE